VAGVAKLRIALPGTGLITFTMALAALAMPLGAGTAPARAATFDARATSASVCTVGYAKQHRKVPRTLRDRIYNRYGIERGHRKGWVIDHRIPLELAGTNDEANLFPKDRDENRLRAAVCSGALTLSAARGEMLRLWSR
jgi:hypothetical protein